MDRIGCTICDMTLCNGWDYTTSTTNTTTITHWVTLMLLLGVAMVTVALRGCDLALDIRGGTSRLHLERSLAELLEAVTHPILTLVNLYVGFIIWLA